MRRAIDACRAKVRAFDAEFGGGTAIADLAFGFTVALMLIVLAAGVVLVGDAVGAAS